MVVPIRIRKLLVKIRDTGYRGSKGLIERVPNKPSYESWSLKATMYLENPSAYADASQEWPFKSNSRSEDDNVRNGYLIDCTRKR